MAAVSQLCSHMVIALGLHHLGRRRGAPPYTCVWECPSSCGHTYGAVHHCRLLLASPYVRLVLTVIARTEPTVFAHGHRPSGCAASAGGGAHYPTLVFGSALHYVGTPTARCDPLGYTSRVHTCGSFQRSARGQGRRGGNVGRSRRAAQPRKEEGPTTLHLCLGVPFTM